MSRYVVYITPQAIHEIKDLPGNMRQRVKRAVSRLADDPYPSRSKELSTPEETKVKLRRIRLGKWRILYAVTEADRIVDVIAVRKRPPYDYGDLESLLAEV